MIAKPSDLERDRPQITREDPRLRWIRDSFAGIGELFSTIGSVVRKIHEEVDVEIGIKMPFDIHVTERMIKYGVGGVVGVAGVATGFFIVAANPDTGSYIGGGLLGAGSIAVGAVFAQNPD